MIIETTRFGSVEVRDEDMLVFEHGLPGFPEEKSFAFIVVDAESPFSFLQSLKDPNLTFLLVNPFLFFKDYEFELDDAIAASLGFAEGDQPQVSSIVTVPESINDMTVNLLAPIVINWKSQKAVQVVLENKQYSTRHRLLPENSPKAAGEGVK